MPNRKKALKKNESNYHHGDLKSAIINASLAILKTTSPDQLSLREIARKLGVSQTAPYRHFKSKEEILAEISKQGFERKLTLMKENFERYKNNPKEMHYACAESYFKMAFENPQHYKLMFAGGVCPSDDYPELQKAACETFAQLTKMIIHSQQEGVMGKGDPYLMAMNYWSIVNGFTSLYIEKRFEWMGVNESNVFQALRNLVDMVFNGAKHGEHNSNFHPFCSEDSKKYIDFMKEMIK